MESRLMNLDIKTNLKDEKSIKLNLPVEDYARAFVDGMSPMQLQRFKLMLKNNIQSGMSVARSYGVDYEEFINEVKKILF